jgi:hypothetical protein
VVTQIMKPPPALLSTLSPAWERAAGHIPTALEI